MTIFEAMNTLADRLQKILSEMEGPDHGKQSRLAKIAGCERATISHYLRNPGAEIGYEYAKNMAEALRYNIDWIISGRPPERIERADQAMAVTLQYVDATEAEILTLYRSSTEDGKDYILRSARITEKLSPVALNAHKPQ